MNSLLPVRNTRIKTREDYPGGIYIPYISCIFYKCIKGRRTDDPGKCIICKKVRHLHHLQKNASSRKKHHLGKYIIWINCIICSRSPARAPLTVAEEGREARISSRRYYSHHIVDALSWDLLP